MEGFATAQIGCTTQLQELIDWNYLIQAQSPSFEIVCSMKSRFIELGDVMINMYSLGNL